MKCDESFCMGAIIVLLVIVAFNTCDANAADYATDSTMVVNCRDVPDKWVMTCLDRDAFYGANEWGEYIKIEDAEICECPEGSRKKYSNTINASDPPSQWVECWTVKTVCDTVWAKEE